MAAIDGLSLGTDILKVARDVLAKDLTELVGFSRDILDLITEQAAFIAASRAKGDISQQFYETQLQGLARTTKKFVTAITGMATIAMERVWNAIVEVLWGAIEGVVGSVIPIPGWKQL